MGGPVTFCVECKDEFDPVENADLDTPLCSSECEDSYWTEYELGAIYGLSYNSGAPVFGP